MGRPFADEQGAIQRALVLGGAHAARAWIEATGQPAGASPDPAAEPEFPVSEACKAAAVEYERITGRERAVPPKQIFNRFWAYPAVSTYRRDVITLLVTGHLPAGSPASLTADDYDHLAQQFAGLAYMYTARNDLIAESQHGSSPTEALAGYVRRLYQHAIGDDAWRSRLTMLLTGRAATDPVAAAALATAQALRDQEVGTALAVNMLPRRRTLLPGTNTETMAAAVTALIDTAVTRALILGSTAAPDSLEAAVEALVVSLTAAPDPNPVTSMDTTATTASGATPSRGSTADTAQQTATASRARTGKRPTKPVPANTVNQAQPARKR